MQEPITLSSFLLVHKLSICSYLKVTRDNWSLFRIIQTMALHFLGIIFARCYCGGYAGSTNFEAIHSSAPDLCLTYR